ncbi:MAG: hypothetical protein M3P84_11405, partial [Chloroflexota bacterium]|nr:hypothetical protein [Chloroflexota bacterium]
MNDRGVRSRHLGIDLGATNLKWALVERVEESWRTVDRGHEPTLAADGPDAVIQRLIGIGRRAIAASQGPPVASIGIGVPGLY